MISRLPSREELVVPSLLCISVTVIVIDCKRGPRNRDAHFEALTMNISKGPKLPDMTQPRRWANLLVCLAMCASCPGTVVGHAPYPSHP